MTAGIGSIGITSEHRDFAESVRGWLARAVPPAVVRAALDAEGEERPAFWGELAKQGLLANHLPENLGGADAGLLTLAIALEEAGRAALPGPFLPTAIAGCVSRGGDGRGCLRRGRWRRGRGEGGRGAGRRE